MNLLGIIHRLKQQGNVAQMTRGAGGGMVVRGLSALLTFALAALMTNLMGAVEYGKYTFVVVWLNFLVLFSTLGFHRSAIRYVSSYVSLKQWDLLRGFIQSGKRSVFLTTSIMALISLTFVFVSREYLEARYGEGFVWTAGIAIALLVVLSHLQLQMGFLDGFKKVVLSQVPLQVVRPIAIGAAMAGLAIFSGISMTAPVTMLLTLAATLVAVALSARHLTGTYPPESFNSRPRFESKEWLVTSGEMMLASGFSLAMMQVDVLMMGILVDTTEGGIYSIASKLAGLLIIANIAVNATLHPMVADLFAKKATSELQRVVSVAANAVFVLGLLSGGVLFFWAEFFLSFFGAEYVTAALPLRVFIIGVLLNLATGPGLLVLNMTGFQRDSTVVMGVASVVNILLNAWFIPRWGAFGAALSTSISFVGYNLAAAVLAWLRLRLITVAFRWP